MSLPEALERAATALAADADDIRPANGDPVQLLHVLSTDAAPRVLAWILANEVEAAGELVETWARESAGIAPLLAVDESEMPKAARKLLRRARHALRSSGVDLPEASPTPVPKVGRLPDIEDSIEGAAVSPIDARGGRVAYIVEPNATGGARLFELILDEERGILECQVYAGGRSGIRGFLRQVSEKQKGVTVPAEPDAVRALVARCARRQGDSPPAPRDFIEWQSKLVAHGEVQAPGEQALTALSAEASSDELAVAAELVKSGDLGPWPPDAGQLDALATRLKEVHDSPLVVSGVQQRARLEGLLDRAAEELYVNDYAEVTARRLEESAYVFWKKREDERARACAGAAGAFRKAPSGDNPVARALLEVMLEPLLTDLRKEDAPEGKDEDEDSLLIKP